MIFMCLAQITQKHKEGFMQNGKRNGLPAWSVTFLVAITIFAFLKLAPSISVNGNKISFEFHFFEFLLGESSTDSLEGLGSKSNPSGIRTQPQCCVATVGQPLLFLVEADNPDNYIYQWQFSVDNGCTWVNSQASTSHSSLLTYTAVAEYNGRLYRCLLYNLTAGKIFASEPALLVVYDAS